MKIRRAMVGDAAAANEVLRRSIEMLCVLDHRNDPAILGRWLASKTPDLVASWITQPRNTVLVAVEGDAILGVGAVTDAGEIRLNYVSPDARFQGVSRAMIGALEDVARKHGNSHCHLTSTETARRFYREGGYREVGSPIGKFGTDASYPMSKVLVVPRQ
jgi:GNAT superfamily N-acetyltransferase